MHLVGMPERGLFRAGRWRDVDRYPPPAEQIAIGNRLEDGYRWEDVTSTFSTIKCSVSAEAAIGRTIARYRRRLIEEGDGDRIGIIDRIMDYLEGDPDPGDHDLIDGRVPDDVFDDLYAIHVPKVDGVQFVDLGHHETLENLRGQLDAPLRSLGAGPICDNLAREPDRRLTRLTLRVLHNICETGVYGDVAGVRLPGQPHAEWEAFVIWVPPEYVDLEGEDVSQRWVSHDDHDVVRAAKRLGLELPPAT